MISNRLKITGIIFLAVLFGSGITLQAQALTWDDFAKSLSTTVSEGPGLSIVGLLVFVLIILIVCLIVLILSLNRFQHKNTQRLVSDRHKRKWAYSVVTLPEGEIPQKRMYYRLRADTALQWLPARSAYYANNADEYYEDRLWDISAGGLSFVTQETLNLGDKLIFLFDYGGNAPLRLEGSVTRLEETPDSNPQSYTDEEQPCYNVGIRFNSILEDEREIIISWIMKRQRTSITSQSATDVSEEYNEEEEPTEEEYRLTI